MTKQDITTEIDSIIDHKLTDKIKQVLLDISNEVFLNKELLEEANRKLESIENKLQSKSNVAPVTNYKQKDNKNYSNKPEPSVFDITDFPNITV